MSTYYELRPEVAGQLGEDTILDASVHPPGVTFLHYEFDDWLGDDILESFPCYIVTKRLEAALLDSRVSGCEFDVVEVTKSGLFDDLHSELFLPEFSWLKITGRAGVDDFGISSSKTLIVSDLALKIMQRFTLKHCAIKPLGR